MKRLTAAVLITAVGLVANLIAEPTANYTPAQIRSMAARKAAAIRQEAAAEAARIEAREEGARMIAAAREEAARIIAAARAKKQAAAAGRKGAR